MRGRCYNFLKGDVFPLDIEPSPVLLLVALLDNAFWGGIMKQKVILYAVVVIVICTVCYFGMRKLIAWVVNGDRKDRQRKIKKKRSVKKQYQHIWENRLERKGNEDLFEITVVYILILVGCLGVIIYAAVNLS